MFFSADEFWRKFFALAVLAIFLGGASFSAEAQTGSIEITGSVVALDGRNVSRARITLSGQNFQTRFTQTNSFGHFRFKDVPTGQNLTVSISHKRFQFNSQNLNLSGTVELFVSALPSQTDFALDQSFGTNGRVITDFGGNDRILNLLGQPDGKLIAFGSSNNRPALARYLADGTLDESFGANGKVISTNLAIVSDFTVKPSALQSDGKIVFVGRNANFDFVIERRNADGSIDKSFGNQGLVTFDFGGFDEARAVVVQADDKIMAVGLTTFNTQQTGIAVVRLNTNGTIDESYGTNGRAIADTPSLDEPHAAAIQPDGRLVVCGILQNTRQMIVRFETNGALDANFGTNGIAVSPRLNLQGYDLAIQRDGKILGIGEGLARYVGDGALDESFNGKSGAIGVPSVELQSVAVRADGLIVAAGRSFLIGVNGGDFGIAFVHPFTAQVVNRTETDILTQRFEDPKDIFIQPDGKIVVGGYVAPTNLSDFALVRYVNF